MAGVQIYVEEIWVASISSRCNLDAFKSSGGAGTARRWTRWRRWPRVFGTRLFRWRSQLLWRPCLLKPRLLRWRQKLLWRRRTWLLRRARLLWRPRILRRRLRLLRRTLRIRFWLLRSRLLQSFRLLRSLWVLASIRGLRTVSGLLSDPLANAQGYLVTASGDARLVAPRVNKGTSICPDQTSAKQARQP